MGISTAVSPFLLLVALLLPPPAAPFSFTYNFTASSDSPSSGIAFQEDTFFNKFIRLTRDERLGPITSSADCAFFSRPIPLSDPVSRRPASFAFAFSIAAPDPSPASGDGLALFLSPFPSSLPNSSAYKLQLAFAAVVGASAAVASAYYLHCRVAAAAVAGAPCVVASLGGGETERDQAPDWGALARRLALDALGCAVLGCGSALAVEDSIKASGIGLRMAASLRRLGWPDEAVVFTLTTQPVLELRGAIPVGY